MSQTHTAVELRRLLAGTPYLGYTYAYPHKTAYRSLDPTSRLADVWRDESRDSLTLYLHVPFCEMRCGFCNLFTSVERDAALHASYLAALSRQAQAAREAVGPVRVAQFAVGGGTPTLLDPASLARLFELAREWFDVEPSCVPTSVETSPATALADRLSVLRDRGVERVSLGVQSFVEAECAAAGRPQSTADVLAALDRLREFRFPVLNVDLMYGLPGQTRSTWEQTLSTALCYRPEELHLYPLYVRPLTGLDRRGVAAWDADRLAFYRHGRDLLRDAGYIQLSMRRFRLSPGAARLMNVCRSGAPAPPPGSPEFRPDGTARADGLSDQSASPSSAPARPLPATSAAPVAVFRDYCCQEDGMLGLGCGARSYTRTLHYSAEYAVGRTGVRDILAHYLDRTATDFAAADYGFRLDAEEQRRRYVLTSLLHADGLNPAAYSAWCGAGVCEDFPVLHDLPEFGLAVWDGGSLRLTDAGLERSDVLGPWFYSTRVRALSTSFPLR